MQSSISNHIKGKLKQSVREALQGKTPSVIEEVREKRDSVIKSFTRKANIVVIFTFIFAAAVCLQYAITNPTNIDSPEYLYIPMALAIVGAIVYSWSLM